MCEVGKKGMSAWKLYEELSSLSTLTHMACGVTTTQAQKMFHLFPEGWSPLGAEPKGRFWLRDHTDWKGETRPGRMMGKHPA